MHNSMGVLGNAWHRRMHAVATHVNSFFQLSMK